MSKSQLAIFGERERVNLVVSTADFSIFVSDGRALHIVIRGS